MDLTGVKPEVQRYVHGLEAQNQQLLEELRLLRHKQFGRSSEKLDTETLPLFDEPVFVSVDEPTALEPIQVPAHERKSPGRKALPDNLERVEILLDISEADKRCACGHDLARIGEETSERLQYLRPQVWVERHIRPIYACKHCEGSGDEDKSAVRIAPVVPSIIPHGIASPSLLATVFTDKFCDHLPFYRQEQRFARLGISLSRQDMSHWAIKVETMLRPVLAALETSLLQSEFIQMDETPVQVMREADKADSTKSYMWLARGGPPGKQVLLYKYHPTRSSRHPAAFLSSFTGYLQTDGYEAYEKAIAGSGIRHVGCWAHARRKFDEAAKASKQTGSAHTALAKIGKLYATERVLREQLAADTIDDLTFVTRRTAQVRPILADLKTWLDTQLIRIVPSSLIGKAISYTIGQWDKLIRYSDLVSITPDNNACENGIRPFVLGRKNWLFSGSPAGADASCALFTLIETAKANGFEPWAYLYRLFTMLPKTPTNNIESLLPFASNPAVSPGSIPLPDPHPGEN